jgi:uncharacterized iron-regulated membrane protein
MNSPISKDMVKQALSAHAAVGLLASALLYLICLTGALAVFAQEWQRIEQPGVPEMAGIAPEKVQAAINQVVYSEKGKTKTTHLFVHLPDEDLPRTTVTTDHQAVHVDTEGKVAGPEENAWTEFLDQLHYQLHLPSTLGLIIVGIFGVMMVMLSVSGIIAHPRIFRDAFRLRARDKGGVGLADWHNRLGVWTLPFAIAIALTGAVIGLAIVTSYGIAQGFYGGKVEAVYAPIFGGEGKADTKPAGLPDAAAALHRMALLYPDAQPTYIVLHDPMTVGQHIQIIANHPRRLIFGEYYHFDASGRFTGKSGLSDGAVGQQVAASMYKLHFGNYGGLPVKLAYLLFGLALCGIIATGTSIWLGKRERRGIYQPRLRNGWDAVIWGIPLALAVTFAARLVIGNDAPLKAVFWLTSVLIIGAALILPPHYSIGRSLRRVLSVGLAACTAGFFYHI